MNSGKHVEYFDIFVSRVANYTVFGFLATILDQARICDKYMSFRNIKKDENKNFNRSGTKIMV